ncbi:hypothetical protein VSQ32_17580 [Lachnospiraceae bacterium KK002]
MISDKLYELAFEYKKRKLWKILWDLQLFGVKLSDGRIGYISIMGAAGEHCALGLYVGDEGMESFRTIARANRYQLSPLEFQEHLLQQNCLQCAFEGKNELSEQELEEARAYARAHDIRISGKNAYPQFVKYQSNHYPWHLQTEQEQELLCQALQAAIELSEILKSTTPIALGLAPVNDLTEEILMLEPGEKGFVLTSTKLPCIKPKKWPAPKAGNDIGIASLKRMERMGVWECELLRFPEPVRNKPEEIPYFPIILLAVESSTNYILPVPPVEHYEDNPEELLNLFMESLQQQKICPDRIKVRDQRTAAFVKAFCSRLKITVSMEKELPALETAEADFLKHFSMSEEEEMDEMIQMMETILELNKEQVESLPENMVEQIDMILEQGILPEELEWKVRRLLHPELADNRPDKSAFRTVKSGRDHSYVISVSLGTGCYRHIRISGRSTLWDLHSIILEAFGFDDDHAHAFFMDNVQWSRRNCYFMRDMEMEYDGPSTEECSLDRAGLCKEKQFKFLFDFGDEWLFQCKVLRVLKEGTEEPEVIKSKGEAPKQYPDWEEDDWEGE